MEKHWAGTNTSQDHAEDIMAEAEFQYDCWRDRNIEQELEA